MFAGCDPGQSGALGLVSDTGELVSVQDIVMSDKRVDPRWLAEVVREWFYYEPLAAFYIEQVGGWGGQGAAAAFNFGRVVGAIEQEFGRSCPLFTLTSAAWRKNYGIKTKLKGSAARKRDLKNQARAAASRMWPDQAHLFTRVMDGDRAETALIAEAGRRRHLELGMLTVGVQA